MSDDAREPRWRGMKRAAPRVPAKCLTCEREFMALRQRVEQGAGKFCSSACSTAHNVKHGLMAGENNPRWKGGVSRDNMRYRSRSKARNPRQEAARQAVRDAIRSGALVRQPCEKCGAQPAHGHHDDYSKPLDVRWLCREHHDEHHSADRHRTRRSFGVQVKK